MSSIKWPEVRPFVGFALSQDRLLYLVTTTTDTRAVKVLRTYSPTGQLIDEKKCGAPPSKVIRISDCWLPGYVSKNGNSYWFMSNSGELSTAGKKLGVYDRQGTQTAIVELPGNIGAACDTNICKFSQSGELYYLELGETGYQLTRTSITINK